MMSSCLHSIFDLLLARTVRSLEWRRDYRFYCRRLELTQMDIQICLLKRTMIRPTVERTMVETLEEFFARVVEQAGADFTVTVVCQRTPPEVVTDKDVAVYLVESAEHSAFARFGVAHRSGHGGLTASGIDGGKSACEVYVEQQPGTLLARLIFHEVLHNKTGWGNRQLHSHHHGGVSAESLQVNTALTAEDVALLVANLDREHEQWWGG